eukprot:CAMPEP_0176454390 /NCGR_PEP_ID=MMETSP0127-20121128/29934_1 /TAXON_ID=938130 /ORGANISM="Platyophrya macrostoma, Strain WH" /LENGTH=87 /DNA_ID=CAMNT_0017843689 /DNA_START=77 /DNA_END=337 /DNA_ORIENTATION=+
MRSQQNKTLLSSSSKSNRGGNTAGGSTLALLQKISAVAAGGRPVIQETFDDDAEGYRIVVVERRFMGESVKELGITLTDDALVENVA